MEDRGRNFGREALVSFLCTLDFLDYSFVGSSTVTQCENAHHTSTFNVHRSAVSISKNTFLTSTKT